MNCPLCEVHLILVPSSDFLNCPSCNVFLRDKKFWFSHEQEKNHYAQHNNDIHDKGYQNFNKPFVQLLKKYCKPTDIGLDFGCGPGPVVTKMLSDENFNIKLYDPYFYPNAEVLNKLYDYIFAVEVVEHFNDPLNSFKKLFKLLKDGGYLLIQTEIYRNQKVFNDWYYIKDLTHVIIYTEETVRKIAEYFKVQLIFLEGKYIVFKKNLTQPFN